MSGKTTMYLVGQITADMKTYEWRENVEKELAGYGLRIINPCNSDFDKTSLEKAKGDNAFLHKIQWKSETNLLVPKDRSHVRESHIIVANLNLIDPLKHPIGSFFELAWAYGQDYTVVIGIYDGNPNKDPICSHPFVRAAVHTFVKDEFKACDLIKRYMVTTDKEEI